MIKYYQHKNALVESKNIGYKIKNWVFTNILSGNVPPNAVVRRYIGGSDGR